MGECDYVLVYVVVVFVPKVWDESEDVGRDLVDWCHRIPPEPNQVEDLKNALFQNIELNATRISRNHCIRLVRLSDLNLVERLRGPGITSVSPLTRRNTPPRMYLASIVASCRNFLVALKCWNIEEPRLVVKVDMMVGFG